MNDKKIDTDELKKIQIGILDYVTKYCKENKIKFWLDSGTLLGAIRHKGYIPWDDDIDIGMLREDYDKFLYNFNKTADERYRCYSIENNENFLYPHAKVLDTSTILYEPDINGNKLSVNIDIFIYDNAPEKPKTADKMYNKRDLYIRLNNIKQFKNSEKNVGKAIIKKIIALPLIVFPKNYFVKKTIENSRKYVNENTTKVGNFCAYTRILCNKDIFASFVDVDFEGKKYPAPIGYDKWLSAFYGDYMQLPPKEKQVSHHTFEAYYK